MPEVSRRAVMASALGGLGLVALAPAAPAFARTAAAGAATATRAATSGLADPVRSLFTPAIGRPFTAVDGDRALRLVLTAVEDLHPEAAGDEHRFLLLFSTDGWSAGDGIFTLSRAGAPDVALFLSPIGRPGLTHTMQAVVDRTA